MADISSSVFIMASIRHTEASPRRINDLVWQCDLIARSCVRTRVVRARLAALEEEGLTDAAIDCPDTARWRTGDVLGRDTGIRGGRPPCSLSRPAPVRLREGEVRARAGFRRFVHGVAMRFDDFRIGEE